MKKFFAVVLMAVAFAMPSKAQVSFGLQAGLNMTNISTEDEVTRPSSLSLSRFLSTCAMVSVWAL